MQHRDPVSGAMLPLSGELSMAINVSDRLSFYGQRGSTGKGWVVLVLVMDFAHYRLNI